MKVSNKPEKGLLGCIEGIRNGLIEIDRFQEKKIKGLLTICAWCKKVRDDQGYWKRAEAYKAYIFEHSYGSFTHGICPDCAGKLKEEIEAY